MARPKGSKNKKSAAMLSVAQVEDAISKQQAVKFSLITELDAIQKEINNLKQALKGKKKELTTAAKQIAKLEESKALAEAAEAAAAKQAQISDLVGQLLNSGLNADEILELLK